MILLIKPQTYPLPSMVKPLSVSSGGCDIGLGLGGGVIGLDSSNKLGGGAKAAPPEWKINKKMTQCNTLQMFLTKSCLFLKKEPQPKKLLDIGSTIFVP